MLIRPIEISDIPACVNIYKLNNPNDDEKWHIMLENELRATFEDTKFIKPKYFVAEKIGTVLGFGGYSNCGYDIHTFGLMWCNVHPNHQGIGIGKALVRARLEAIKFDGGQKVFSSQRETMTWHLERFGFERLEGNGEYENEKYFLMRKQL